MLRTLLPVSHGNPVHRMNRDVAYRDPFAALQTEMNRLLDDAWSGFGNPTANVDSPLAAPRIEVNEDGDNFYVTAELPGMSEDDVDVTYDDGVLRIAGEKKRDNTDERRDVHVTERAYGRFERQLPLGHGVKEDRIDAKFKDGVLAITAPKTVETQTARKIDVKRAA